MWKRKFLHSRTKTDPKTSACCLRIFHFVAKSKLFFSPDWRKDYSDTYLLHLSHKATLIIYYVSNIQGLLFITSLASYKHIHTHIHTTYIQGLFFITYLSYRDSFLLLIHIIHTEALFLLHVIFTGTLIYYISFIQRHLFCNRIEFWFWNALNLSFNTKKLMKFWLTGGFWQSRPWKRSRRKENCLNKLLERNLIKFQHLHRASAKMQTNAKHCKQMENFANISNKWKFFKHFEHRFRKNCKLLQQKKENLLPSENFKPRT